MGVDYKLIKTQTRSYPATKRSFFFRQGAATGRQAAVMLVLPRTHFETNPPRLPIADGVGTYLNIDMTKREFPLP